MLSGSKQAYLYMASNGIYRMKSAPVDLAPFLHITDIMLNCIWGSKGGVKFPRLTPPLDADNNVYL